MLSQCEMSPSEGRSWFCDSKPIGSCLCRIRLAPPVLSHSMKHVCHQTQGCTVVHDDIKTCCNKSTKRFTEPSQQPLLLTYTAYAAHASSAVTLAEVTRSCQQWRLSALIFVPAHATGRAGLCHAPSEQSLILIQSLANSTN